MTIAMEGLPNPRFEFGDRIRKVRRSIAGLSQAEMAEALGVTRQAYAAWESGGKPADIVAVARRVEQLWPGRVTASWVAGFDDDGPPPPQPPTPIRHRLRRTPVVRLTAIRCDDEAPITDDALAYLRLVDEDLPTSKPVDALTSWRLAA